MKIIIPGEPQGKARARTVRCKNTVHSFTPEKTVLYENLVKTIYLREIAELFSCLTNLFSCFGVNIAVVSEST